MIISVAQMSEPASQSWSSVLHHFMCYQQQSDSLLHLDEWGWDHHDPHNIGIYKEDYLVPLRTFRQAVIKSLLPPGTVACGLGHKQEFFLERSEEEEDMCCIVYILTYLQCFLISYFIIKFVLIHNAQNPFFSLNCKKHNIERGKIVSSFHLYFLVQLVHSVFS